MKNSKMKKTLLLLLAAVLLVGCSIGGTLAYLQMKTDPVVNTFVAGNIGTLTLTESKGTLTDGKHEFTVVPGVNIEKDPKVSFSSSTVDAYVFVKVSAADWTLEQNNTSYHVLADKIYWDIADGWTYLTGDHNKGEFVYYKAVTAENDVENAYVINENKIVVDKNITQTELNTLEDLELSFTAYAIQQEGFKTASTDDKTAAGLAWDALTK